jgi:hypothetical protein
MGGEGSGTGHAEQFGAPSEAYINQEAMGWGLGA